MSYPYMELNILATSNQQDIVKLIPRSVAPQPDYWTPWTTDIVPMLQVLLPDVNKIPPEEYPIMTVKITAIRFQNVTVTVINSANINVFSVRCFFRGNLRI